MTKFVCGVEKVVHVGKYPNNGMKNWAELHTLNELMCETRPFFFWTHFCHFSCIWPNAGQLAWSFFYRIASAELYDGVTMKMKIEP